MKTGRIVLIVLGFIVLCLAYYCLFPKYEVEVLPRSYSIMREDVAVLKLNRITGQIAVDHVYTESRTSSGYAPPEDTPPPAPPIQ